MSQHVALMANHELLYQTDINEAPTKDTELVIFGIKDGST
jgi:hypothetical protein